MKDYTKDYPPEELEPFFPNELLRHLLVIFLLIIVEFLGVVLLPETAQDRVDPLSAAGGYDPKPLWFLLPIYGLFGLIPSKTVCFALLGCDMAALISLPFWDRVKERRLWKKRGLFEVVIIWLIIFLILGILGRLL
jgi:quinol-cytochrome oxidoreductase complex cytochrome b subunit